MGFSFKQLIIDAIKDFDTSKRTHVKIGRTRYRIYRGSIAWKIQHYIWPAIKQLFVITFVVACMYAIYCGLWLLMYPNVF